MSVPPPDPTGERLYAPRFYGRRHGRKLRAGRARLVEALLPSLTVEPPRAGAVVDWSSLFGRPLSGYAVEIGFGAGEHLAAQARAHPNIGYLGCEPFINGITTLLAEIDAEGIDNIRIFPDDVRLILPALPTASVGRCYILFPDPWPKRRHRDRRLVAPAMLDGLARLLEDGASLRMASDHPVMVDWMLFQCRRHPDFDWAAHRPDDWRTRPGDWPPTRYEVKALHGQPVFLAFRRRCRAPEALEHDPLRSVRSER